MLKMLVFWHNLVFVEHNPLFGIVSSVGASDNVTEQSKPINPVLQTHTPKTNIIVNEISLSYNKSMKKLLDLKFSV